MNATHLIAAVAVFALPPNAKPQVALAVLQTKGQPSVWPFVFCGRSEGHNDAPFIKGK